MRAMNDMAIDTGFDADRFADSIWELAKKLVRTKVESMNMVKDQNLEPPAEIDQDQIRAWFFDQAEDRGEIVTEDEFHIWWQSGCPGFTEPDETYYFNSEEV